MDAVMQLARAASSHQYLPRNAEDDQQQQPQDGPGASTSAAAAGPSSKRKATHPPPPASAAKNTRRRRKEAPEEAQTQTHEEGESYATSDVPPNTMKHDDDDQQQQQVSPEEAATAAAAAAAVWAHRHGQSQHYDSTDDQHYDADASHHHTTEHQLDPNLSPLGNVNDHTPSSDPSMTHHHNLSIDNPAGSPSQDTGAGTTLDEQDQVDAEADAEALRDGNPRVLRTTKRAAQNRAAQRAFRERRDRHIKDLETRASQFDALQALYGDVQARYGEALAIIAALKRENEQLRGGGAGSAGSSEHDVMNQDHGRGLDAVASAAVEAARMAGHEEPSQTQDSAPQGE